MGRPKKKIEGVERTTEELEQEAVVNSLLLFEQAKHSHRKGFFVEAGQTYQAAGEVLANHEGALNAYAKIGGLMELAGLSYKRAGMLKEAEERFTEASVYKTRARETEFARNKDEMARREERLHGIEAEARENSPSVVLAVSKAAVEPSPAISSISTNVWNYVRQHRPEGDPTLPDSNPTPMQWARVAMNPKAMRVVTAEILSQQGRLVGQKAAAVAPSVANSAPAFA